MLSSKYLIFIYLFCFSFLSIAHYKYSHYTALILLYTMLFVYSVHAMATNNLRIIILVCSFVSIGWGIISYTANTTDFLILKYIRN